jgi:hypothetical protein
VAFPKLEEQVLVEHEAPRPPDAGGFQQEHAAEVERVKEGFRLGHFHGLGRVHR